MLLRFRPLALTAVCALLAGCSGGGRATSSAFAPPTIGTPAPTTSPASGSVAATSVGVRIVIPSTTTANAAARRAKYVSPAAQSVAVAENGGTPTVIAIEAGAPNCTRSASGRTCTLAIPATPGTNASFAVKLFASTDGSGAPLAAQTVLQTIVAGSVNTLSFTLNGVVASISVFLQNPTFTVGTAATTNVVVNALDAAGYVIVGAGTYGDANGNPVTIALADGDGSGATKLAQTTVTQPATIALSYNGAAIASATITATAGSLATATATLSVVTPGAIFNADQVSAAIASTLATYATMPHTGVVSDINALAAQMVASGAYTAAAPGPGAISARLPDGTTAVLFTDRQEDLVPQTAAAAAARRPAGVRQARAFTSDAPTPHQVVFLVNGFDPRAFAPSNQQAYASAVGALGFAPPNAGVSDLDVTLDNIVALGGAGIDLLDLSTHGGIDTYVTPPVYVMDSTTPITAANNLKYKADLAAGLLVPGGEVTLPPLVPTAHYAFTMAYLTKYLHFNPGAIVLNNSCFGQSPDIAAADDAVLRAAGVGRYSGWTKSVNGGDADQSDAFLFDRLLGEDQGAGLQGFAQQRDPIQRAFPLDDVQTAMTTETRAGAFGVKPTTYAVSDDGAPENVKANPIADGTAAKLVVSDYGGETVANPPTEYGLPSIGTMSVVESATGGVLTIDGRFPSAKGTVLVGGTEPAILTWTTTRITVQLPASGSGSAGLVFVQSADGILSSAAPLTLWSANLTFTESDTIAMLSSRAGVGSGNVEIDYALNIRSDVDPLVTTIDTPPVAQNFAFTNPMGSSTAVFAAYDGTFASNDGKSTATFSTGVGVPPMTPSFPPLQPGTFEVRGFFEGPPPASCNNGLTGVQGGPANILCPITGAYGQNAVFQCVDSGENPICPQPGLYDLIASYGAPYDAGGQLTIVMNPQTYALTATATTTQFQSLLFGGEDAGNSPRAATATMTGSFSAPKYAPTYALPASTTTATARAPFTAPAYRAHLQ